MSFPELSRRAAFAAVLEATPGAGGAPTMASNAIRLVEPPTIEEMYLAENLTDDIITGRLGVLCMAAPGARAFRIRGRAVLVGKGTAYANTVAGYPEADALHVGAGMTRTVTVTAGSEKVEYQPNDDPSTGASSTLAALLQLDGQAYAITYGVVEEYVLSMDAGGFPVLAFAVVGIATDPVQQALQPAGYANVNFPIWKGAGSLAISGVADLRPRAFELNLGLSSTARTDANAADGHSGYRITGRVPEVSVDAEVPLLASWNPRADMAARTSRTMSVVCGGGLGDAAAQKYKRFKVDAGDVRTIGVESQDADRLRAYKVKYRVAMPAAGTELKITYD